MTYIKEITTFMFEALVHVWPLLAITIPFAALMRMSGGSQKIGRFLRGNAAIAIILATVIGAVSPLCSCSVIPAIAALLASGVPLGPVMAFWIASPSMDPEIFFLSASTLGWDIAIWRIVATTVMSLGGGFIAHVLQSRGAIPQEVLKENYQTTVPRLLPRLFPVLSAKLDSWIQMRKKVLGNVFKKKITAPEPSSNLTFSSINTGSGNSYSLSPGAPGGRGFSPSSAKSCCSTQSISLTPEQNDPQIGCGCSGSTNSDAPSCSTENAKVEKSFLIRFLMEMKDSGLMVLKFMLLAYFLEALIILYLPEETVSMVFGKSDLMNVLIATGFSIPLYTTNLSAMGLMGGLLNQGLAPGAVLAFLIGGATTTIPAMAAVFGLTHKRVFALYLSIALIGSVLTGLLFTLIM